MARLPYDGFRADYWSLAVALFAMVSGFFPVEEATQRDWRFARLAMMQLRGDGTQSTTRAIYDFYSRPCPLSDALVQLLDLMLNIQPPRRLPLHQTLASPWVTVGPSAVMPSCTPSPAAATRQPVPPSAADAIAAAPAAPSELEVDMDEAEGPMMRYVYQCASLAEQHDAEDSRHPGGALSAAPPQLRRQRAHSQRVGADEETR